MQDSELPIENKGRTILEQQMMEKQACALFVGYTEDGDLDVRVDWGPWGFIGDSSAHVVAKQFLEFLETYFTVTSALVKEADGGDS